MNKKLMRLWIALLVIDRLVRYVAIAIAPPAPIYWDNRVTVLFVNLWNPNMAGGADLPSQMVWVLHMLGPIGITAAALVLGYAARTSIKNLWAFAPIIFSALSNLTDRFIWGMVSDPLMITLGSDAAIAVNIADVLLVFGVVSLLSSIWWNSRVPELYSLVPRQAFMTE